MLCPAANVNSLQVNECRNILQEISNIVYANSAEVPNLRILPDAIKKLVNLADPVRLAQ